MMPKRWDGTSVTGSSLQQLANWVDSINRTLDYVKGMEISRRRLLLFNRIYQGHASELIGI
jgi:hypothetical protein